ncbi:DUF3006 domain-containing protein [Paenibacillus dokdonensis]|uniref:DUF3006 domain-containing protein n=1 Tax=Paenibacillus dokdonensis TaxID=2567944 RepID=A0ABU6GVP2_9BACL|nr:DUF3006 domain-containing protein [Paenibacillus dokdonensis]MEC0243419.1 DUF3006 domain-containing protein [Paenibacillus dokdonensis]
MKGRKGYVEGFEEEYCKIEIDGSVENIPKIKVASHVKRGDVVELNGDQWVPNPELTRTRSEEIKKMMDDVWED